MFFLCCCGVGIMQTIIIMIVNCGIEGSEKLYSVVELALNMFMH